ncbi:MAG TPA: hypothetical protein PLM07_05225 [Candidatus Rifleibacterium sp.]|nr:hypothetical protein [Candidatus Rifleibacterium sp.]HPT45282.1 hypothetical protein [Candidatus Rifleibacterium sp.]
MRRFVSGILVAGVFFFCGSSQAMAQRTPGLKEVNERIQALRQRLQNYQSQRGTIKQDQATCESADLIVETPEPKVEKIVEELENRKDVAVTVLFHDPDCQFSSEDFADAAAIEDLSAEPDNNKIILANAPQAVQQVSETTSAAAPGNNRLARYEELRKRVYLATRNARTQAHDINRQIARIN